MDGGGGPRGWARRDHVGGSRDRGGALDGDAGCRRTRQRYNRFRADTARRRRAQTSGGGGSGVGRGVGAPGRPGHAGRSGVAAALDVQVDAAAGGGAAGQGHPASEWLVRRLLHEAGYSLQATAKPIEGAQHPDRDAQFRYLNDQVREHLAAGQPVISVDTKKKELVGRYKNGGREWQPAGRARAGQRPRLPRQGAGQGDPVRGLRPGRRRGLGQSVGADHDTAAFAVATIRRWWQAVGAGRYPHARPAADHRRRGRLQRLPHPAVEGRAGRLRRRDRPGGHRLPLPARHHQVEQDRAPAVLPHLLELARRPLTSHEVVVDLIAATTTRTGLTVHAELDHGEYPKGIKVSDKQIRELEARAITRHDWHGEWNYTVTGPPRAP